MPYEREVYGCHLVTFQLYSIKDYYEIVVGYQGIIFPEDSWQDAAYLAYQFAMAQFAVSPP